MTEKLPTAAANLLKRLPPGWTHKVTHGTGVIVRQRNDSNLHKQVITEEPCTSVAIRLRNTAGRAAVAVWAAEQGYTPHGKLGKRWHETTGKLGRLRPPLLLLAEPATVALLTVLLRWAPKPYEFDAAWAWWVCRDPECPTAGTDHPGVMPKRLDAAQLTAYLTSTSAADYARQLDELAAKRRGAAAKAAATRAAKRATTTEVLTSVSTEGEAAA